MYFIFLLALVLPLVQGAALALREPGELARRQSYSDARFTWYDTGL